MILEIKITHDGKKFCSFEKQQRTINSVLRKVGIPIEYCYNEVDDYTKKNDTLYTLEKSSVSPPDLISNDRGVIENKNRHQQLKNLVDKLLEEGENNGSNVGALFSKGLVEHMRNLNMKMLFLAYNSEALFLFDEGELSLFNDEYQKLVDLEGTIDWKVATEEDMLKSLEASKEKTQEVLREHLENKPRKGFTPSF